jgi:hypothetical protein
MLPTGSSISEAQVLRGFMRNIEHAALRCGPAGGGARLAYFDAKRRLDAIMRSGKPNGKLAGPKGKLP